MAIFFVTAVCLWRGKYRRINYGFVRLTLARIIRLKWEITISEYSSRLLI